MKKSHDESKPRKTSPGSDGFVGSSEEEVAEALKQQCLTGVKFLTGEALQSTPRQKPSQSLKLVQNSSPSPGQNLSSNPVQSPSTLTKSTKTPEQLREIAENVRIVLKLVTGQPTHQLPREMPLLEGLSLNDIQFVDIQVLIEETFGIVVDDEVIDGCDTVGHVISVVTSAIYRKDDPAGSIVYR